MNGEKWDFYWMFLFDLFFSVGFVALKEIRLLLWGFLVFLFGMITFL